MARMARESRLESRHGRLKLSKGKRFWKSIDIGLAIGYRRTGEGYGTWLLRSMNQDRKDYFYRTIGRADDNQDADGIEVLTFSQVQEKARSIAKAQRAPGNTLGRLLTVADAAEHYLNWFKDHRKSYEGTRATVQAHILPAFGKRLVCELKSIEIRNWLNKLATQPPRKRTPKGLKQVYGAPPATDEQKRSRKSSANRILTVFKAILNKAFTDDLLNDDTAWRKVKPFSNADEPVTRFLTEEEAIRLINASPPDFSQLVMAALFTGARYGQLARLTADCLNPGTGMLYIKPAKNGKGHHVPLSPQGLDFFTTQSFGKKGSTPLLVKEDGTPWGKNHHVRLMKAACENARISPPIGFHELRHTYASLLAQAGADLLTISKLLGHSDTRVTSRHYAHLCDKTLAATVNNLLPRFGHTPDRKVRMIR